MDYESPWRHLFEASLPPPAPDFEAYNEFETDQKARGNQQAFNYFLAAGPGSPHESSNITDTDKKGQDLEATKDQVAKKRKIAIDKAYRERCRAGANVTDLQRENTQLKSQIILLMSQVNDQNNVDKLQLQEKNAQLEHEKSSLEVIVQALCEKINNEKGHEGDHAS